MAKKPFQFHLWYFVIACLAILPFFMFKNYSENVTYTDFKALLKSNHISGVTLDENYITATLKPEGLEEVLSKEKIQQIKQAGKGTYSINTVRINDPALLQELDSAKVPFTGQIENKWVAVLYWMIPAFIFIGLWSFLMKRSGVAGGSMAFGKNKAKIYMEKQTKVTFHDVAGVDEAKGELIEVVEFLKNPKQYYQIGARLPKGVLLVGPPGTGKTLLARAVAGEAGVPFFSISGSEFVEMFAGVGAARVRDLFEQARLQAPAIIFIDEIDALGRARCISGFGGHDEKEQTLNQLLSEMDGFDAKVGLVLLAATNRPEILDQALLRAGRFDRQVLVDRPDKIGRLEILRVYIKRIVCDKHLDPEKISVLTPGFTGADLANLVNEAALLAIRRNATTVNLDDFTQAVERISAGLEKKNRVLNKIEREIVAYHEVGHALTAQFLLGKNAVQKISIIPRGIKALGYTMQRPTDERYLMTQDELQNKLIILLGGRAAELVKFGHLSTGAADDLNKATDIARAMVMNYGMNETLGDVIYVKDNTSFLNVPEIPQFRNYSEETAREIDHAVRDIIKDAHDKSFDIVKHHKNYLEQGAQLLLQKETLEEKDLAGLMSYSTEELIE
jgi:cell division protease FtsH